MTWTSEAFGNAVSGLALLMQLSTDPRWVNQKPAIDAVIAVVLYQLGLVTAVV